LKVGKTRIGRLEDFAGDGPFTASTGTTDVVVVRAGGALRAFEGRCPHQGALLGEGEVDGDTLVCRNHRWRFALGDGRRLGGPGGLRSCPLAVEHGDVWIDAAAIGGSPAGPPARRRVDDLPGPRRLPFLGNALSLEPPRIHRVLERWADEYGKVYRFGLGPRPCVAIADAALAAEVLRARPETFRRLGTLEAIFREMGIQGVFSAEGDAWRPQRKLAMEALSTRHLRGFYPLLHRVTDRLRLRWQAAARAACAVDIRDDLMRFTIDVTTSLVFGHDVHALERDDDELRRHLGQVLPGLTRRIWAAFPYWRIVRLPADRRLDRALAAAKAWIADRIVATRRELEEDPERAASPAHFFAAMLAAHDADGRPFSDDLIFGNAMNMLIAGEDTTANTLAWAVHHLCDNAEARAALHREADEVLGSALVPADLDVANRLPLAAAVASETLRLRPVGPVALFECNHDVVVGDLALPSGSAVCVISRPPALEADSFADPREFRPWRWMDGDARPGPHRPAAAMPFGSGPRVCPGRTLALIECRVVLATLFRSFAIERVGVSSGVEERFAFTMGPTGLMVKLTERAD
jgi:cytochrome P450/nitrite reductase/ring-hydroxylating ferredoxin subunit